MFCPYPDRCVYNLYQLTDVHFCALPKCRYPMAAKSTLRHEIQLLQGIHRKTPEQAKALAKLQRKYKQEFGEE